MLTLPIKRKWYNMIKEGKKKEEYREIKQYYISRLQKHLGEIIDVKFRNGYSKNSPALVCRCRIDIGRGLTAWGAEKDTVYYVLEILSIK